MFPMIHYANYAALFKTLCITSCAEDIAYRNWVKSHLSGYRVNTIESRKWVSVPIGKGHSPEEAWKLVVEVVGEKFAIELIDSRTYYLRTGWKETKNIPTDNPSGDWAVIFRSQLFVSFR
jgi:uncharacterized lipoprotein